MDALLGQAQPHLYEQQLDEKICRTKEAFAEIFDGNFDIYASPKSHFRMRAEFKIWHQNDIAHYAMYEKGEYKKAVVLNWEFSIGSKTITALMPKLLEHINNQPQLKHKLFQVEFLTSQSGECLVTLIYHRKLEESWTKDAHKLSKDLGIHIIGRSRKQKLVLSQSHITECFNINDRVFSYEQVETGFTQPNASICRDMLNWAALHSRNFNDDLLELYCGNGNFTLPLSINFEKVIATEISKTSVNSALTNIKRNEIHNIDVLRMSSEEFTQAWQKEREFRRLKDTNLDDYNFSTIFLDPPRAGLDSNTLQLAQKFEHIIYISCNPETLLKNLNTLNITHQVERFALFDQFPYTNHLECGVILTKR